MRVAEKIVRNGKFWLPSDPETEFHGKLIISDGGKIRLEMTDDLGIGMEGGKFRPFLDEPRIVDTSRILGKIEKEDVTLDGCFCLSSPLLMFAQGINTCHIHVSRAMLGVGYKSEVAKFNTFRFSVEGLEEWLGICAIEIDRSDLPSKASIKYSRPEDINLSSIDGVDIQLVFEFSDIKNLPIITEATIKNLAYIKLISKKERPLSDFITITDKLNSFLCFAIDKTVSIKDVVATSNPVLQGDSKKPAPVKIFYRSYIFSPKKPEIYFQTMLFPFPYIKDNASDTIKNWIKIYKTTYPSISLCLHKAGEHRYMDDEFLTLAQGLEVYHRKTHPNTLTKLRLNQRLCDLLNSFKKLYSKNGEIEKIAEDIAGIRNYLIHRNNRFKDKSDNAGLLDFLSMKMESIFQLHLLKEIGFTDGNIKKIAQKNPELKQKLDMNNTT